MKKILNFRSDLDDDEAEKYRVTLLETRVRGLELIVHRLLRDRVEQNKANKWLDLSDDLHSIVTCASIIDGLGREIASEIDRSPDDQRWEADQDNKVVVLGEHTSG